MSVSVVLEWENMAHAASDRPRQTMAALRAQADALYPGKAGQPKPEDSVRLSAPLEVILPYDSDKVDEADLLNNVADLLTDTESLRVRLLPVINGTYCRQKNEGAAGSTGDLIIFLDSDVTPEPTWLTAYLKAFLDPRVQVAVGNTYVDTSRGDAYSRAMALTWMFPLRDTVGGLGPTKWFYANNVAFRRDVFRSHPFPETPGIKHHPAALLVQQLERDGIPLWHAGDARGHHPPPNGFMHFFTRAVAAGRERTLRETQPSLATVRRWLRSDLPDMAWYCKRILVERSTVNMPWRQVPAAIVVALAYHTLRLFGSLATYWAPGLMRDRFQI